MSMGRQVAVVTGAARGIGSGVAAHLARRGFVVGMIDRDAEPLDLTVQSLRAEGLDVHGAVADLTQGAAVDAAFAAIQRNTGPIGALVNNAGAVRDKRFLRMEEEDWDFVLATNLRSQFLCCRAVLAGMSDRGSGRIVNMSARAWLGAAGQAAYSAAKGGTVSLTRSLAIEFAGRGITVNAVAPGVIDTPLFRNFKPELQERLATTVPTGRIGTVEDVAAAVGFFLDPSSAYITGQTLYVCGGRSLASASV
ncbi:SDR family NAD(P)-dependent oxidoreductase [Roseomonas sp. WA12]